MNNLYIAASPIAGKGLFTDREIEANQAILSFTGERIFHEYTPEFALMGSNWIGVGDREWVIPEAESPVLYLNHCCDPNVFINEHLEIISMKHIEANSELFLDYSTTELDPYWSMYCNCASKHCRKTIKSFPYLSYVNQLKYKPFISSVFLEAIQKSTVHK